MIFETLRGKYCRDEQYMKSAMIGLDYLCQGALEATCEGLQDKRELINSVI